MKLNSLFYIEREIKHIKQQIEKVSYISAAGVSSVSAGTSSPVEAIAERLDYLNRQYNELLIKWSEELAEMERFVNGIEDDRERLIARMYYIERNTQQAIGDELYIDQSVVSRTLKKIQHQANCIQNIMK